MNIKHTSPLNSNFFLSNLEFFVSMKNKICLNSMVGWWVDADRICEMTCEKQILKQCHEHRGSAARRAVTPIIRTRRRLSCAVLGQASIPIPSSHLLFELFVNSRSIGAIHYNFNLNNCSDAEVQNIGIVFQTKIKLLKTNWTII